MQKAQRNLSTVSGNPCVFVILPSGPGLRRESLKQTMLVNEGVYG